MRKTKNVLAAALIAAIVVPAFQGCKKGEGDPFISLRSRKARVAGEWTFSSLKDESSYSNSSSGGGQTYSSSGTDLFEVTGTSVRVSSSGTDSDGDTYAYSGTGSAATSVVFEKDGKFAMKYTFSNINITVDGMTMVQNITSEMSGTWNFLGGVEEDYKKKERIILNVQKETQTTTNAFTGQFPSTETETYTQTYANGEYAQVWRLTTLKNKEMVIEAETGGSGSYTSSYDYGSGMTGSSTGNSTSKGMLSGTLEQE